MLTSKLTNVVKSKYNKPNIKSEGLYLDNSLSTTSATMLFGSDESDQFSPTTTPWTNENLIDQTEKNTTNHFDL